MTPPPVTRVSGAHMNKIAAAPSPTLAPPPRRRRAYRGLATRALRGRRDCAARLAGGGAAQREALGPPRMDVGHVTAAPVLAQRADDGGPGRAVPAGDDDVAIAIVHRPL